MSAALWAEKHRPQSLAGLSYHCKLTQQLQRLCTGNGFPHVLMCGPPGAGKKTRIMATLAELFGDSVHRPRLDTRTVVTPSGKKIEVPLMTSNYHVEFNPTDVGIYDRLVVQEVIKEMAKTQNIDSSVQHRFRVVVVVEAESLSVSAQHVLRRTMEKYMTNMRMILCCNTSSKIIPAIQSRCLFLRVSAPLHTEVVQVLQSVSQDQGVVLPAVLADRLAEASKGNVRRALLMLEALYVVGARGQTLDANTDLSVVAYDWEVYISATVKIILQQQTPEGLLAVRERLYELLAHCIPAPLIIRTMSCKIAASVRENLKPVIAIEAARYDHSLALGTKPIYHLEAFAAKIMSICKLHQQDLFV